MSQFLYGVLFLGYAVIAGFFIRYWSRSGDRLFLYFALSFALMAVQRALLAVLDLQNEIGTWVYWLRLLSYLVILAGILDRNMRRTDSVNFSAGPMP